MGPHCFFWLQLTGWLIMMALPARGASPDPYQWAKDNHLMAHALGGLNGWTFTNCMEAFTYNYAHGQRIFEVDLTLTSDNQLACVHGWSLGLMQVLKIVVPAGLENKPLSLAYWKSQKLCGHYMTLGASDLATLLYCYRDAYFVLDTKESTTTLQITRTFNVITQAVSKLDPALLDRVLPEIYSQDEYGIVMAIHPFKSVLYCPGLVASETPAAALAFVKQKGIRAMSMPDDHAWSYPSWSAPSFLSQLNASKIYSFFYTVNDLRAAQAMMRDGATGFYTDTILPSQLMGSATKAWTINLPVE